MKKIVFEPVGDVINYEDVDQDDPVFVKSKNDGKLIGMCVRLQKTPSVWVWVVSFGKIELDDLFEAPTLRQLIENFKDFEFFVED